MQIVTFFDDLPQGFAIIGKFCYGFAVVVRLSCPVVHGQGEMMGGDRARYCGTTGFDSFHCSSGCCVLKDNPKLGEGFVKRMKMGKKLWFCIDYVDVL